MSIKVQIPTPLQKVTQGNSEIEIEAGTIKELINNLENNYPGIKERICDDKGEIRKFINLYVNEEDIRFLKQEKTKLHNGDEVSIIPAIAGGSISSINYTQ